MERKKEADSLQSEDRKIELLLQESFGYSDEQLLKELEMAEAQAESAKMAEEEELLSGQRDLPEQNENAAPSDEFEEILKKMRERGIEPRLEKELNQPVFHGAVEPDAHLRSAETSEPERPPEVGADHTDINHTPRIHHFGRKTWGIILAAALAGALLWATGIGVSGRKTLEYEANVRDSNKSDIAWNNESENYTDVDSEDEAYKVIGEKLGIPVLKLGYRPDGMKFSKLIIEKEFALIVFEYQGKKIHLMQGNGFNENSDAFSSDRTDYIEVKNEWLERILQIEKNINTSNQEEYSVIFERDKYFYYLGGILPEDEFEKIAADTTF